MIPYVLIIADEMFKWMAVLLGIGLELAYPPIGPKKVASRIAMGHVHMVFDIIGVIPSIVEGHLETTGCIKIQGRHKLIVGLNIIYPDFMRKPAGRPFGLEIYIRQI